MAVFSVRRSVWLTLYAALASTLGLFYFSAYPLPGFFLRVREVGTAVLFLIFAANLGRALAVRMKGLPAGDFLQAFLLSAGLGMGIVSLALLGLGTAGGFRPPIIGAATLAAAVLTARHTVVWFRGAREALPLSRWTSPRRTALLLLGAGVTAGALLCAWAPPTYYDSLVYHLALPARYLMEGRVGFVPYNQYAHFPQGMEMIFGWFLALGDDIAAHCFNVLLILLNAGAMVLLAREIDAEESLPWGLLLWITAPCVVLLSVETYVEPGLAFMSSLSLWAALKGRSGPLRWMFLAGIFGGLAAGIKYTGALTPLVLTGLVLFWPGKEVVSERVRKAAFLAAGTAVVFAPWLVKNYVLTGGNPVFPFLPALFPARNVLLPEESSRAYFQVLAEYKGQSALLVELFHMPLRLATQATSFGGGYDVLGDLGWVLPFLALPLFWSREKITPAGSFLAVYLIVHTVLWGAMRPVLRFLFPVFPVLCVLAGSGLARAWRPASRALRAVLGGVTGLFLLGNGVLFHAVERVRDPLPVALGEISREDYLRRKLPGYEIVDALRRLPPDARVLFVGDPRGYYSPRRYTAPMALLPQPLALWAEDADTPSALADRLRREGFTHVFFNRHEAERLKEYSVFRFPTEKGRRNAEGLFHLLPAVFASPAVGLFQLPP
jgi:hypothetical protein